MGRSPPERDVLLATKLQVPRSRPGLVPRRRLADRLEEGLNRGLVLVAAPAGYGKSVLLSEWVRGMTGPVAWLSLDGGDNDPVRFWRHVLAALDTVRPGIAERVSPLAGPPAPPAYDSRVSALINDVVAEPDQPDMLLVLDDYHLISSDSVQASVRFLLAHRPPQLRMVLASRSDPPLGLARYRGRGELGEVRAADLRFNLDEAAELLRQVSADLDLSIAAALAERTEGWAVGLQLAALSLRTQPDVARFVAEFTGSHRYVLDYLTEEVLSRQRQDLRNFLLETSVLDRLSGSLCNAVTGRDDSQDLLEEVDRSGLFVGAARRRPGLVALPPPVRRPAPDQAGAGPGACPAAAPQRRGVVRAAGAARRGDPPRPGGGRTSMGRPAGRRALRHGLQPAGRAGHHPGLAAGAARGPGSFPPPVAAGSGADGKHAR
jgi:LuxR family maltose regulon positive regulatory protein